MSYVLVVFELLFFYSLILSNICFILSWFFFFFFKKKTAYDMRIRYWSSDVCSSDLSIAICGRSLASKLSGSAIGSYFFIRVPFNPFGGACLTAGLATELALQRLSIFERVAQGVGRHLRCAFQNGVLHDGIGRADQLALAEPFKRAFNAGPYLRSELELAETAFKNAPRRRRIRQRIFDHFVETAREGFVQNLDMIGRRQHETVGRIRFLHEGQHGIENPTDFADIVRVAPARADRIEFIEQLDAARLRDLDRKSTRLNSSH